MQILFKENPTGSTVSSSEATLERAFASREGLIAVATSLNIPTFSNPSFFKSLPRVDSDAMETAYAKVISKGFHTENRASRGDSLSNRVRANGILEFKASARYAEYQYMRFCHKVGVFDGPINRLLPEDVDRLFTCGFLTEEDFDFDLGRFMLAYGAYNRVLRQTDQKMPRSEARIQSKPLPEPYQWTIDENDRPCSPEDILMYVTMWENIRRDKDDESFDFEYAHDSRPLICNDYIKSRQQSGGRWGLKHFRIDDERAEAMIMSRDATFVPPGIYDKGKRYGVIKPHSPSDDERIRKRKCIDPCKRKVIKSSGFAILNIDITESSQALQSQTPETPSLPLFQYHKHKDRLIVPIKKYSADEKPKKPMFSDVAYIKDLKELGQNASRLGCPGLSAVPDRCFSKRQRDEDEAEQYGSQSPVKKVRFSDDHQIDSASMKDRRVKRSVGALVPIPLDLSPTAQKRRFEEDLPESSSAGSAANANVDVDVEEPSAKKQKLETLSSSQWEQTKSFTVANNHSVIDPTTEQTISSPAQHGRSGGSVLRRTRSCGQDFRGIPDFLMVRKRVA